MISCDHRVCGKDQSIWIQTKDEYSTVERHLFCTECGVIQNRSDDRPKAVGYWMNKLGALCLKLGLTQCQKRLIAKELERNPYLNDTFGSFGSSQEELFLRIISSYYNISKVEYQQFRCIK